MVEQFDVPLEGFLPIIHMGCPVASLDSVISQTTCGTKRIAKLKTTFTNCSPIPPKLPPEAILEDLKKAIAQALSGLNETEHIAAAFQPQMNLHDVRRRDNLSAGRRLDIINY